VMLLPSVVADQVVPEVTMTVGIYTVTVSDKCSR
jgi:hypothetical protein